MKIALHSSHGAALRELDLALRVRLRVGMSIVKRSDLQDVLLAKAAEEGMQVQFGIWIISIKASDKQGEINVLGWQDRYGGSSSSM
jgi:hypothetical protein